MEGAQLQVLPQLVLEEYFRGRARVECYGRSGCLRARFLLLGEPGFAASEVLVYISQISACCEVVFLRIAEIFPQT